MDFESIDGLDLDSIESLFLDATIEYGTNIIADCAGWDCYCETPASYFYGARSCRLYYSWNHDRSGGACYMHANWCSYGISYSGNLSCTCSVYR